MLLARLTSLSGSDISEVGQDFFFVPKEKVALLLAFGAPCCGAGKRLLLSLLPD